LTEILELKLNGAGACGIVVDPTIAIVFTASTAFSPPIALI